MDITFPTPSTLLRSEQRPRWLAYVLVALVLVVALWVIKSNQLLPTTFPAEWDLRLREPIDQFKSWVIGNRTSHPLFLYFFDPLSDLIESCLEAVEGFLLLLPWPAAFLVLYALGYLVATERRCWPWPVSSSWGCLGCGRRVWRRWRWSAFLWSSRC